MRCSTTVFPGLIGGDWNGSGPDPDYDPDPYEGVAWHPDHARQLDEHGRVDRSVAICLERIGHLQDCARLAGAPYIPTAGRHPADTQPLRRWDRWYGTHDFPAAAAAGFRVGQSGSHSDHDFPIFTVEETLLPLI